MEDKYIIGFELASSKTAGGKAQGDINQIALQLGYRPIVYKIRGRKIMKMIEKWNFLKKIKRLPENSTVIIQYPTSVPFDQVLSILESRNLSIVTIMHDVGFLRSEGEIKEREEKNERRLFEISQKIIVHNETMKKAFVDFGVNKKKIISLDLFDYLSENINIREHSKSKEIIIAGNLHQDKCGYVYKLEDVGSDITFNLYGINYTGKETNNINYKGVYRPEVLPSQLEGAFGLVWDGEQIDTCAGKVGDYLRYNNPHKLSLYLVAGIPAIVWSQSATAQFVMEHNVGITVDSLNEIHYKIDNISAEEYRKMCDNCSRMSAHMREGFFTKTAIKRAVERE